MSIFGGTSAQSRTRNLVEFKAGKMFMRSNMVHPDSRKGLVYIHQGPDTLMHFCWKDRTSSTVNPDDDLVIFANEVEFKKVTQNTTGRVYILKWKNNNRKFFFWMQEPKAEKDDELCKKVNDLLNNPPAAGFGDGSGAHNLQPFLDQLTGGGGGGLSSSDLTTALRGLNPSDLASLLSLGQAMGGPGAHLQDRVTRQSGDSRPNTAPAGTRGTSMGSSANAVPATTRATATSSRTRESGTSSSASSTTNPSADKPKTGGNIQMNALTTVLSTLAQNPTSTPTTTSEASPVVDLNEVFSNESLIPLLSNKNVQEKLRPHLPEGYNLPVNESEFRDIISSPQFRQAVSAFSLALQSGQLGPVLTQFNFPNEVIEAANRGDLQAFAREFEKHLKNSKSNDPSMETD